MKTMIMMLILAGIGTVVWAFLVRFLRRENEADFRSVSTELPEELRSARSWGKELKVECKAPRRIHGRIDEAFELSDGTLVITETKTRKRATVHQSDIVQASLGGLALAKKTGRNVSGRGYIRLITPGGNSYAPIKLLREDELVRLYDRFKRIKAGLEPGEKCGKQALCARCEYRTECSKM